MGTGEADIAIVLGGPTLTTLMFHGIELTHRLQELIDFLREDCKRAAEIKLWTTGVKVQGEGLRRYWFSIRGVRK